MRILNIFLEEVVSIISNIPKAVCVVPVLSKPLIHIHEFVDVDNMITSTSKLADSPNPTSGEYSLITKSQLEACLTRIRRKASNQKVNCKDILKLCDTIQERISGIDNDCSNGTLIRIARYIFEVYDIYDIATSEVINLPIFNSYVLKLKSHMSISESIFKDLHDREYTINAINSTLERIDNNVLESMKVDPNFIESPEKSKKLSNIAIYIQICAHSNYLTIQNCYITTYNLKAILNSVTSLYSLYEIILKRQCIQLNCLNIISEVDYFKLYLDRTEQIHYIAKISERIFFELTFRYFEIMDPQNFSFYKKIKYLKLFLELICEPISCTKMSKSIIRFVDEAYRLFEAALDIIKIKSCDQLILSQISKLDSEIEKAIFSFFDEFGYAGENIKSSLITVRNIWESYIDEPDAWGDYYNISTYSLLYSLAAAICMEESTSDDFPKYIFKTFMEVKNTYNRPNEERVKAIVCTLKDTVPHAYNVYLCVLISSLDSFKELDNVFEDDEVRNMMNTFFRTTIQKIYKNKFSTGKNSDSGFTKYTYFVISGKFLASCNLPVKSENKIRKLSIVLDRIINFHAQHVFLDDEIYETMNLLCDGLLNLKKFYKKEFEEIFRIQFIILSMNLISCKIVMNSKDEKIDKYEISDRYDEICGKYFSLSSIVILGGQSLDDDIDDLNCEILEFIYENLTREIDNEWKIIESIFAGYCLIFSQNSKFKASGNLLIFIRKLTNNSSEAVKFETHVKYFIQDLKLGEILRHVQNKEKLTNIGNDLVKKLEIYVSEYKIQFYNITVLHPEATGCAICEPDIFKPVIDNDHFSIVSLHLHCLYPNYIRSTTPVKCLSCNSG